MFFIAGLIRSPFLYGLLSVPACVFGFGIDFGTISDAASSSSDGLLEGFYAFIFVSLIAYPVLLVIHALALWLRNKFRRRSHLDRPVLLSVADALGADFANPFRGLGAIQTAISVRRRGLADKGLRNVWSWFVQIVHFVWALAVWGYFAFSFAAVATR